MATTVKGVATFNTLKVIAQPGSTNVLLRLYSPNIQDEYIKSFYFKDNNTSSDINDQYIMIDFRYCIEDAKYVRKEHTLQQRIPKNVITALDNHIALVSSSDILCAVGYQGNLCHKCSVNQGLKYAKYGQNECVECQENALNILFIIGLFLILLYLTFLIYTNMKFKDDRQISVIMRIFTNYLQMTAYLSSINLDWPINLKQFYQMFIQVGQSYESIMSVDCFMINTVAKNNYDDLTFFKTVIVVCSPIALIFSYVTAFAFIKFLKNLSLEKFKDLSIMSIVVVIYFTHPTVTKYVISKFHCLELDNNELWLMEDLQIKCWEGSHFIFAFALALPLLLIWVLGLPIIGFYSTFKRRYQIENQKFMQARLKPICQGLKKECFYWEFFNVIRKVMLISVNVFLQKSIPLFKAMFMILFSFLSQRFQQRIKPYQNPLYNELEYREMLSTSITFFATLFFVNEEIEYGVQVIFMSLIIISNLWFISFFILCILRQVKLKFIQKFLNVLKSFNIIDERMLNENQLIPLSKLKIGKEQLIECSESLKQSEISPRLQLKIMDQIQTKKSAKSTQTGFSYANQKRQGPKKQRKTKQNNNISKGHQDSALQDFFHQPSREINANKDNSNDIEACQQSQEIVVSDNTENFQEGFMLNFISNLKQKNQKQKHKSTIDIDKLIKLQSVKARKIDSMALKSKISQKLSIGKKM
ncbi:UNKNOWN [Stylonychia lemnae]|uniref:Transmembrane protein n=1 Tax=Stylonychia lemnae TaxID=5949 RepID=A0A077ZU95_STYLE|nr:UNKNOWN [Stylonychia lemnae]|eukprot:CDW73478.1 UNKNOWN [Stylonychia lemnae]